MRDRGLFKGDTIIFGGEGGGVRKDTTSLSLEWWVLSVYNSFDQLPNKVIKTHQFLEL